MLLRPIGDVMTSRGDDDVTVVRMMRMFFDPEDDDDTHELSYTW